MVVRGGLLDQDYAAVLERCEAIARIMSAIAVLRAYGARVAFEARIITFTIV